MFKLFFIAVLLIAFLSGKAQVRTLRNGQWRAVLERADSNNIIFNFEVKDSNAKKILYIRNAAERLLVDDIAIKSDSILIRFPFFESQLRAVFVNEDELNGVWIKRLADKDQVMPFKAFRNQPFRFSAKNENHGINVSGRWAAIFKGPVNNDSNYTVGEFSQNGNELTGTFLDPTGDYRFLQGVVDGDSLRLSCFDGSHAYLFTAKIESNQIISNGKRFSGPVYKESWEAKRDPNAKLEDEFSVTKMKPGESRLAFRFKDLDGKFVSLDDEKFKDKVVIVQLMGSWCPNCMDETSFLSRFYDQYRKKGVEIIGLAYERSADFARSQKSVRAFQQRLNVHYTLLITGVTESDSLRSEKTLPQLQTIEGFPTSIFIGRDKQVKKILTGFNGPATGEHYEEEKNTFYETVEELLR